MFKKILIANRGEVALRVMRACKELGVKTVAVYSTEDANTYPVQYADEAVCIGPAQANKSYLIIPNIIAAAKTTGAEAVHPGYGFLAENADFARACADNDLVFIGPSPECIERMGDKSSARETMKACGVPTVPGSDGCIETAAEAKAFADTVGYPVLIKATAGGGGKGMREVHDPADLEAQYAAARNEAGAAFGNDGVYLEKLVLRPRHVEIQVLADDFGNNIALCERDCSVQRRHQKLIEEAPSPALTEDLRRAMGVAAIKAVRATNYKNAGTIEFLLDERGVVLLHGDEHAGAGGAPGDRADHRHRHHQGAAAHRLRRAYELRRSRAVLACRPCDGNFPHQTRKSPPAIGLPSVPRHHHEVRSPGRPRRARGKLCAHGFAHLAVLRFAGGETRGIRPGSRGSARARPPRARRVRDRGHRDHDRVPSSRARQRGVLLGRRDHRLHRNPDGRRTMTELNVDGMALAPGVVETIVSIAANEVDGVASVGPSATSSLRSVFAGKPSTQGIEVAIDEDDKLQVSVRVDVYYGYVLPDLAANLRKAIADAVSSQVGASVASVDVYIDGIQFAR